MPTKRSDIPATCPNWSASNPINGVMSAPPETPIIINAEISLSNSARCCNA